MPMPTVQLGVSKREVTVNVTSNGVDGPGAKTFGVITGDVSNTGADDGAEIVPTSADDGAEMVPAMAMRVAVAATVQLLRM